MQETAREYTKRILSYQQGMKPMTILTLAPQKITRLLRGVPGKKLATRPGRGIWSVAEILGHLADAEVVFAFRMRLILGSNRTHIQAFDQDAWAGYSHYAKQGATLSLEAYRVQRAHNIRLLKLLPRKMWNYYGMHSERGKETITRMTEMMAGHDINHLRQIERLVRDRKNT